MVVRFKLGHLSALLWQKFVWLELDQAQRELPLLLEVWRAVVARHRCVV